MTIAVDGKYTPTEWFSIAAVKKMKIISWTFNRGFSLPGGGWYYSETADITDTHGDQFELLDVLYKAGLYGLFSDYPEFVSFYMSCIVDDFASKGSGMSYISESIKSVSDPSLKAKLDFCDKHPSFTLSSHPFTIGHRGAPGLPGAKKSMPMFPEHSFESYRAAAEQGAGIIECDVAVTKDNVLVCRHSQCDLHSTTNILSTGLVHKCGVTSADKCCTSDLTLAEFKTLEARQENDVTSDVIGTLITHAESIELIKSLGLKFTPELKAYTQGAGMMEYDALRAKVLDEYVQAGVSPEDVYVQSFVDADVDYWLANNDQGFKIVQLMNQYGG